MIFKMLCNFVLQKAQLICSLEISISLYDIDFEIVLTNRAEGALSSVAVRSGARIFECSVYIHTYLLCRLGEWFGAAARTLAVQD